MELTDDEVAAVKAEVRAIRAFGRVVIEVNAIEGRLDIVHEERQRFRAHGRCNGAIDKTS